MATDAGGRAEPRSRLTRDQVLRAAIASADAGGLEALTMRTLAEMLGVAPMALYRHVANKDDLIDGMVDVVFSEIGVPSGSGDWKTSMRRRAIAIRDALSRHRWAVGLMESRRRPGPANLRHHDAVIGRLRAAGFDVAMAAHAYSAPGQLHLRLRADEDEPAVRDRGGGSERWPRPCSQPFPVNEYPNLVEFLNEHVMQPGYDYGDEFEYGLELILDGLEQARPVSRPTSAGSG